MTSETWPSFSLTVAFQAPFGPFLPEYKSGNGLVLLHAYTDPLALPPSRAATHHC